MNDQILCLDVPAPLGAHLWLVDLRQSKGWPLQGLLSEGERERAMRFRFERDARRYLVSHAALRQLLSKLLETTPNRVPIQISREGKPFLPGHPLHFNMSHSEDWALIGVHPHRVIGIDLEQEHTISEIDSLARHSFGRHEYLAYSGLIAPLKVSRFFTCWTRKEACLKAIGSGLSVEPSTFEAGVEPVPVRVSLRDQTGQWCAMDLNSLDLSSLPIVEETGCRLFGAVALVDPAGIQRQE
ncbi:MAG TPA: 4'-phosphopantetheinyl transferase superfamily protein [Aquabacterium sp.]|nr:4'-phosphopantetheinyl transferase superfamily protein [Aquabacterium sp.]